MAVEHVVVVVQENHTTDNYFRGLAPFGANVATGWPLSPNPATHDQPHDRKAYARWLADASTAVHAQYDTRALLPYYLGLALTGAFLENHCAGFGTNSTPNHLLLLGGQSPTLKNPSRTGTQPVWDLPSLPAHAEQHGLMWKVYAAANEYPTAFYRELKGSPNVRTSADFVEDVTSNGLPALTYLYHDSPQDEHPPADVTIGMNAVWQAVDAVVRRGLWATTVFMLTWDDWGGWDDHVATPFVEYTPNQVQVAYGPRVPLLVFGGSVRTGIDSRWCSHVSLPKTALQLLGLPPLGVPRLDDDAGLADLVDAATATPPPPAFGATLELPAPPAPPRLPRATPPPPAVKPVALPPVLLRGGKSLPPPNDAPV